MTRRRLILPCLLAALLVGAAVVIAQSEAKYRVDLSSILEMWGDVLRDADNVGLTVTRVSDRAEMTLGTQLAKPLEGLIVPDPKLQKYIAEVGGRLAAQIHRKQIRYTFHVISAPGINAFALPGGNIFVTKEMIDFAKSEAEIAAIIAHEISHVDLRHCIERFQYELLVRRILPSDLTIISRLPYTLLRLSYSKQQEREADIGAVVVVANAGYHPKYGLALYERAAALTNKTQTETPPRSPTGEFAKALSDALIDYFQTHPPMTDRIGDISGVLERNESQWKNQKFYVGRSNHVQRMSWTTGPLETELRPYIEPPVFGEYLSLAKHFRALAVHLASGISGIGVDQLTPSSAIEQALIECEKKIKPCQIYAVGDMVVLNTRQDEIDAILAKYSITGRIERAFQSYLVASDFKALSIDMTDGQSGTGLGAAAPATAIEEASARCSEQGRTCTLYAVGDVVVHGLAKEQADIAVEQYRQRIIAERIAKQEEGYFGKYRTYADFKAMAVDYSSGKSAVAQGKATPSEAIEEAIKACSASPSSCEVHAIGPTKVRGLSKEERDTIAKQYSREVVERMSGFGKYQSQKDFKAFVVDVPGKYWAYAMGHWHPLAALNSALMRCQESGRTCQAAALGDQFVFDSPTVAAQIEEYRARVSWPSDGRNPVQEYLTEAKFLDFKAFAADLPRGYWWREWNDESPYQAAEQAVTRCREKNPACELYAIGNDVVYGKTEEEKNSILALYAREVLEKKLAFSRQPEYVDFKAIAGDRRTMQYVVAQGRASPADAIEQAMRGCTEQHTSCQLFAVGQVVVFGLPQARIDQIVTQYEREVSAQICR